MGMLVLALDASTNTGWAVFDHQGNLIKYGVLTAKAEDFNVNNDPHKSPLYPYNIVTASDHMGLLIRALYDDIPADYIVIENTNKGKNRHTQRQLEFIHKAILDEFQDVNDKIVYLDTSYWRALNNFKID
jgi:hypothetical protein